MISKRRRENIAPECCSGHGQSLGKDNNCHVRASLRDFGGANTPRVVDGGAHQQERKSPPPLGVKFNGDPQQLRFFLAHVLTYMQEYSHKIPIKGPRVRVITLALEGATAR